MVEKSKLIPDLKVYLVSVCVLFVRWFVLHIVVVVVRCIRYNVVAPSDLIPSFFVLCAMIRTLPMPSHSHIHTRAHASIPHPYKHSP
jgi:hypothetical protein